MAASLSEQENLGLLDGLGAMPPRGLAGCAAAAAAGPPFCFSTPRQLIDWRALHALDLTAVVRNTDIDALESVLDIVAHGDMEGEDARCLTPANAARAFRVAQLAVDYLLHVQDRLAADACSAKVGTVWHGARGAYCGVRLIRWWAVLLTSTVLEHECGLPPSPPWHRPSWARCSGASSCCSSR